MSTTTSAVSEKMLAAKFTITRTGDGGFAWERAIDGKAKVMVSDLDNGLGTVIEQDYMVGMICDDDECMDGAMTLDHAIAWCDQAQALFKQHGSIDAVADALAQRWPA